MSVSNSTRVPVAMGIGRLSAVSPRLEKMRATLQDLELEADIVAVDQGFGPVLYVYLDEATTRSIQNIRSAAAKFLHGAGFNWAVKVIRLGTGPLDEFTLIDVEAE